MKKILTTLACILLLASCSEDKSQNNAQLEQPRFQQDIHYRMIDNPLPLENDTQIVTELFWYGCPHCQSFEPILSQWEKSFNSSIELVRVPAVWNEPMELHAKLYFIAQSLDDEISLSASAKAELHAKLFDSVIALRNERSYDVQVSQFAQIFLDYGLDTEKFTTMIDSSDINNSLEKAKSLMERFEIGGTPTLIVNGKYQVINRSAKSPEEIVEIASFLLQ